MKQKYLLSKYIASIILTLICLHVSAQLSKTKEGTQFNFWIGKWDLYSSGNLFGASSVDTILNGYVIQENFDESPPDPFNQQSWTTYNASTGNWEQTTVDNKGHHSFFIGKFQDGKISLLRNFKNKDGEDRIQRSTFYNITSNSFDWTFDASGDDGKTWTVFYTVHYVRKK